ncbi:uncharacterized protein K02A2.6-like [Armigeres subalbatus]|uniref:uncharacterized protein K02A2.6-like n=1 Tax=Armigeres subalbatus TaxID=124917 RepID=UPI002ED0C761
MSIHAATSANPSTTYEPFEGINRIQQNSSKECTRCGRRGHFATDISCPARGKECNKCKRIGHFATQCRTVLTSKRKYVGTTRGGKRFQPERVREIEVYKRDEDKCNESTSQNFIFQISDGDELLWLDVGGVLLQVLVDSGCKQNIIDEKSWEYLKANSAKVWNQQKECDEVFLPYGDQAKPLTVLGKFETLVKIVDAGQVYEKETTFYVVKGGQQCLLGRATATDLGVLVIGMPSSHGVASLKMTSKYCFPKMKGIKVSIPIDPTVNPVCQHPRRPPIALTTRIEEKLKSLLANDIIEPVEGGCQWVSPLVTVVKDNGDLRLCVDMRRANAAILRERHMMPTIEDFLPRFTSANFFSRLDIKEAFHQVELDESSRYITTFITHIGLFRYKRLMYGIVIAPEIFQRILEQILSRCSKFAVNFIDDIFIFTETEEKHDEALKVVLSTLRDYGVLLNKDKCIFKVTTLDFLGHTISSEGILPSSKKIEALTKFRPPTNQEELRSFLGLVTYIGRFLPDLATTTAPLRELTHSGVKFSWGEDQRQAFEKLIKMIADVKLLRFFDNSLRTRVIADASPVALGAVLLQFEGTTDDDPRPIAYASKSLTPTERRYCQTEKEALALVWAVERFSCYLLGRTFELETDHKPLEAIFKPTSRPCSRIERWVLRLQSFSFTVKYRKGSSNIADPLSRLVVENVCEDFDAENKFMVLAILESAAIDIEELEESTETDPILAAVKKCLYLGLWDTPEVKPYAPFKSELGLVGNVIVRGDKLVVPLKLRSRMLDLAHEGHPGESVMKRRLRDRVWWPGMDREVTSRVVNCEGCRLVSIPNKPEPMLRRQLPCKPWVDIAIDFLGPMPSGVYLLVVIDYYSRYKEVEIMHKITAKETVTRLNSIFTRLGYPRTITLDNAKQFVGIELEEYSRKHGIHLNHSTPYWPQENGLVERQNRSLLKRLQISNALGRNWVQDLQEYLVMYYTTPHSTTGRTPTELLYGRTIRSKIPAFQDIETAPSFSDVADRDRLLKDKGKENEDIRRRARKSSIDLGDTVLMQNLLPGNKLQTTFGQKEYKVVDRSGPRVTIEDLESGKSYDRNVSHLKKVPEPAQVSTDVTETPKDDIQRAMIQEVSDDTSEEDFAGFENEAATVRTSVQESINRKQRTRKPPTRFNDYQL